MYDKEVVLELNDGAGELQYSKQKLHLLAKAQGKVSRN